MKIVLNSYMDDFFVDEEETLNDDVFLKRIS